MPLHADTPTLPIFIITMSHAILSYFSLVTTSFRAMLLRYAFSMRSTLRAKVFSMRDMSARAADVVCFAPDAARFAADAALLRRLMLPPIAADMLLIHCCRCAQARA